MINHFEKFCEFCKYETLYGGPDPHLRAVVYMAKAIPVIEQLWRVHLYVGFYNVPSAEAVWREWPAERFLSLPKSKSQMLTSWIEKNWDGFRTRRERKTVNSPIKMGEYIDGFYTALEIQKIRNENPEDIWEFALSLPRVGRYAASKLLECWHRLDLIGNTVNDIRSRGAWSPRTALAMICNNGHNPYDDSIDGVAEADEMVADLFPKTNLYLRGSLSREINIFEFEVMLCEYKASYRTHRQYPGRSADSELSYENAIKGHWGVTNTEHMATRKILHPLWALGEIQGWTSVRKDLGYVLANYGYTWSDFLYDYFKTTDFKNPQPRIHDGTPEIS